ncbi:MAG: spore germination protein, partial [Clostridiales bacterium]|nr:spore germination protein [Clostridiales bacterium]
MFNRGKRAQKVQQEFDRRISELGDALSEKAVSPSLKDNMVLTKRLFDGMDLIKYKSLTVKGASLDCFLMFCDGMVDNEMINQSIIRPLMVRKVEGDGPVLDALAAQVLQVADMRRETRYSEIVREVMSGNTVLFVDTCAEAIVLSTKDYVVRAVDEPENEKSLVGPREGFTESLLHNLSQIIRRVHTNELKVKMLTIGRRTKTSVCVAYFDSLVDKKLLGRLLDQLNAIDIDGILDVNYITELIRDNKYSVFRTTGY